MSVKKRTVLLAALCLTLSAQSAFSADHKTVDTACIQRSQWISPTNLKQLDAQTLLQNAAKQSVVLLGEQHPDAMHHRWQLQTLTQLYAYNSNIVLGFEMFPRRLQPVLDAWVRGELTEQEFLEKTDWENVWQFDADLYLPLFHFARMNRLPMLALNVDRSLIRQISKSGWEAMPDDIKEGVKTPRKAHPDYITSLKNIFNQHSHVPEAERKDDEKSKQRFNRFMQAQLTWDGAMAQKISHVQKLGGNPLVVGIMGSGHIANRYGVPHQLEELGLKSTILIPWTLGSDCKTLNNGYADAVFGLEEADEESSSYKPMLGVQIEESKEGNGILVSQTLEETVAEDAGLIKGDIIFEAATKPVRTPSELIKIIKRQAPGTWLPLKISRDGKTIDIIAKFPAQEN